MENQQIQKKEDERKISTNQPKFILKKKDFFNREFPFQTINEKNKQDSFINLIKNQD